MSTALARGFALGPTANAAASARTYLATLAATTYDPNNLLSSPPTVDGHRLVLDIDASAAPAGGQVPSAGCGITVELPRATDMTLGDILHILTLHAPHASLHPFIVLHEGSDLDTTASGHGGGLVQDGTNWKASSWRRQASGSWLNLPAGNSEAASRGMRIFCQPYTNRCILSGSPTDIDGNVLLWGGRSPTAQNVEQGTLTHATFGVIVKAAFTGEVTVAGAAEINVDAFLPL